MEMLSDGMTAVASRQTEMQKALARDDREARRALSHQANLNHALNKLTRLAQAGQPVDSEALKEALKPAIAGAAGLDRRLRKRLKPSYYNERCPSWAKHLAQKVFDIPELLEMIIGSLKFTDILKVQQLNKQWNDAVNSSVTIQRTLCLRPETSNGFFRARFAEHRALSGLHAGYRFYTEGTYARPETIEGNSILFEVQLGSYSMPIPRKVGDTVRRMFLCQPPITELECFSCCCSPQFGTARQDLGMIKNSKGLTIGDIWDKTVELLEQHKNCHNASLYQHDRCTGEVKNHVSFRGMFELQQDDPILKIKARKELARLEKERQTMERHQLMSQFHQAKVTAAANGTPVPTFADFQASLAGTDSQ